MALTAGTLAITVEFAQGLKDGDWFGKQDPYAIVKCGTQTFRTKTCVDGGKNPVWNETFNFNVINENTIELDIFDADVGKDDHIGSCTFSLAKGREQGTDTLQAPVVSKKSKKQHGFVAIRLVFTTNDSLKKAAPAPAQPQQPQIVYAMPPPAPYGAPPPYGAAPYGAVPYGVPPPYPYAQPGYPAPYPYGPAPPPACAAPPPAPAPATR